MLQPEQKSALNWAEVARRYTEGSTEEVQEIGGIDSAKNYAAKAMAAAEVTGGTLLKERGDLIVGGDNGVQQRFPIGQPGEAPVANIGADGQIGLKYRPFNMPRMTFRADAGLKLYPGHEYVISPGDTNVVTIVPPEHLTSNDDCRIRIIWKDDTSQGVLRIRSELGVIRAHGSYLAKGQPIELFNSRSAVELSCIRAIGNPDIGETDQWQVVTVLEWVSDMHASDGYVLTSMGHGIYDWKPLPNFALKSETPVLLANRCWVSDPYTIEPKTTFTIDTGLNLTDEELLRCRMVLKGKCLETDLGYLPGDITESVRQAQAAFGGSPYWTVNAIIRASSLYYRNGSYNLAVRDFVSGTWASINPAKWQFYFVIYY